MRALALVLVGAAALVAPAKAPAESRFSANLAWAARQAQSVMPACQGRVHHALRGTPASIPDAAAWVDTTPCVVYLSSKWAAAYRESRSLLCVALAHEYGHLRGLGHSTNPYDLMYPSGPVWMPRACHSRS